MPANPEKKRKRFKNPLRELMARVEPTTVGRKRVSSRLARMQAALSRKKKRRA